MTPWDALLAVATAELGGHVGDVLSRCRLVRLDDGGVVVEAREYVSAEKTPACPESVARYLREVLLLDDEHGQCWRDDLAPKLARALRSPKLAMVGLVVVALPDQLRAPATRARSGVGLGISTELRNT
jgi:hypothetical protein